MKCWKTAFSLYFTTTFILPYHGWLVVLGFNATLTLSQGHIMTVGAAHVFPCFLTPVLTQLSFQSHRLLVSHASREVRGENTLERKFVSTGYRTHNLQVMSPTRLPLSDSGGAAPSLTKVIHVLPSANALNLDNCTLLSFGSKV